MTRGGAERTPGVIDPSTRHYEWSALDVLRAGLQTARWITVDDTGARHKAPGHTDSVTNDVALA